VRIYALEKFPIFMQAQLTLARKYVHIYAHIYASGNPALKQGFNRAKFCVKINSWIDNSVCYLKNGPARADFSAENSHV
jgi:hypothetical protein